MTIPNAESDQQIVGEVVDGSDDQEAVYDDDEGHDEGEADSLETSGTDWEAEARKFQSMHDKVLADNAKMKDALIGVAEMQSRNQGNVQHQNHESQQRTSLSEDEFSPWDAYYKPDSASYKYRVQQEAAMINEAVDNRIGQMNDQMIINNTVNELRTVYKMKDGEISDFMKFATQPTDQLELGTLVKVWKESGGKTGTVTNSLDAVKASKLAPRTPGALQGEPPKKQSDEDKRWKGVMSSARSGSRLP